MIDQSDLDLLEELGIDIAPKEVPTRTPLEERMIAGFEDIQRFVETHGRTPLHGDDRDIFERLYAVRLERILANPDAIALLGPLDHQGLLSGADIAPMSGEGVVDDLALLAELGVALPDDDITILKHVRTRAEIKAAEEIASRTVCQDFDRFKPVFAQVQRDLDLGVRQTRPFGRKAEIEVGRFFILGGQKAYIADKGEEFVQDYGDRDAKLRVIFDNGTESDMLMRSLQRALTKDDAGRRITDPDVGPLFSSATDGADTETGTIYVVRSKSDLPFVAQNRDLVHKIGVTNSLDRRFASASHEAAYLLAEVDLVASWELYNINRHKLEGLLHRFFAAARLDLTISDRFGNPVRPQEWFLVPLEAINAAVEAIIEGRIDQVRFDPGSASVVAVDGRVTE